MKAILPLKYQENVIKHKVANTIEIIYTIIFLHAEEHVEKIKSNLLQNKGKVLNMVESIYKHIIANIRPGKRLNVPKIG